MTAEQAEAFAQDWIAAWNAHDVELILSHYSEDAVLSSPSVIRLVGAPSGEIRGLDALRVYLRRGLDAHPDLRLDPIEVLPGAGSIALRYRFGDGREAIETLELDRADKISRSTAHYSAPAAALA
jgi:SnoaL-like domain